MKKISKLEPHKNYVILNDIYYPTIIGNTTEYHIQEVLIENLIPRAEEFQFLIYNDYYLLEENMYDLFRIYLYIVNHKGVMHEIPFPIYIRNLYHDEYDYYKNDISIKEYFYQVLDFEDRMHVDMIMEDDGEDEVNNLYDLDKVSMS